MDSTKYLDRSRTSITMSMIRWHDWLSLPFLWHYVWTDTYYKKTYSTLDLPLPLKHWHKLDKTSTLLLCNKEEKTSGIKSGSIMRMFTSTTLIRPEGSVEAIRWILINSPWFAPFNSMSSCSVYSVIARELDQDPSRCSVESRFQGAHH